MTSLKEKFLTIELNKIKNELRNEKIKNSNLITSIKFRTERLLSSVDNESDDKLVEYFDNLIEWAKCL